MNVIYAITGYLFFGSIIIGCAVLAFMLIYHSFKSGFGSGRIPSPLNKYVH